MEVVVSLLKPQTVAEAAILTRTLAECAASIAYIACPESPVERDERALRYGNFELVERHKHTEAVVRTLVPGANPEVDRGWSRFLEHRRSGRDAALARFADLEKRFKRGWSGEGFGGMVRAVQLETL